MARVKLRLHGCQKVLCAGTSYVIGETSPSGFGLWEVNGILPLATYPETLAGWNQAVARFLALGDRPRPLTPALRKVG